VFIIGLHDPWRRGPFETSAVISPPKLRHIPEDHSTEKLRQLKFCIKCQLKQFLCQPLRGVTIAGTSPVASNLLSKMSAETRQSRNRDGSVGMTIWDGWRAVHWLVPVMQLVTNFTVFSWYFHLLMFKHFPGNQVLEHPVLEMLTPWTWKQWSPSKRVEPRAQYHVRPAVPRSDTASFHCLWRPYVRLDCTLNKIPKNRRRYPCASVFSCMYLNLESVCPCTFTHSNESTNQMQQLITVLLLVV
jgi:hypothetical protein